MRSVKLGRESVLRLLWTSIDGSDAPDRWTNCRHARSGARNSGKAIGSLICGLLAFIFPAAVAAIILGHISRSEIRNSGGQLTGSGMALAGLIFGYIGASFIPFMIIAAIAIPNLLRARIAANEASGVQAIRTIGAAESSCKSAP
jgi:Domain of unknown function (DUF4190)